MRIKFFYFLISVLSFLVLNTAKAANQLDVPPHQFVGSGGVVINEIAWMGTENSYNDEWIELYNNSRETINFDEWSLKSSDGTPKINLEGTIPAEGFFILERTDDDTLSEITADQIYKGALRNSGEDLELYDNSGNLIDSVDCSSGWFKGVNKTKQTMERINSKGTGSDSDNWRTSLNPGGTPKAQNSIGKEDQTLTKPEPAPKEKPKTTPTASTSDVFINEILPSPEGPDAEEEWIEIFNNNDFEVDLSDWEIKDIAGKTKVYTFPENTKIAIKEFFVLKRPVSKITLNNDGDGVNFVRPDGKIVDEISYDRAPEGQSYNRTNSGWVWNSDLTPGAQNTVPTEIEKDRESISEKEFAAISESISEKIPFIPSFIAFGVALFSGIIILILKKKIQSGTSRE